MEQKNESSSTISDDEPCSTQVIDELMQAKLTVYEEMHLESPRF